MTKNMRELLFAVAVYSMIFAAAVFGAGLIFIALKDLVNSHSFIRLALAVFGAGLVGGVVGVFLWSDIFTEAKVIEDTKMSSADALLTE